MKLLGETAEGPQPEKTNRALNPKSLAPIESSRCQRRTVLKVASKNALRKLKTKQNHASPSDSSFMMNFGG
jgi:hypothetical protein